MRPDGSHLKGAHVVRADELRAEAHRPWLNVPNALTAFRIVLVPAILFLLLADTPTARWWAFGVFVFAAVTDTIDGWVARRWHGVTRWGQLADPVADKLLVIGTLCILAAVDTLPWWAVIVIVVREVGVTLLRVQLVHVLDLVMPASVWGKLKTVSQLVAISLYLIPDVPPSVRLGVLYGAVALTFASGIDYAFRGGRIRQEALAADDDTDDDAADDADAGVGSRERGT